MSSLGDIFGGQGGNPFERFFGGGQQRARAGRQGTDLRIKVKLTLSDIYHGVPKTLKIKRMVVDSRVRFGHCSSCNGTGQVKQVVETMLGRMMSAGVCRACGGSGQRVQERPKGVDSSGLTAKEETLKVNFPAGVEDGMQLSMQGKGNEPPGGGEAGDLLILVQEVSDERFMREGSDVIYQLTLNFADTVLGKSGRSTHFGWQGACENKGRDAFGQDSPPKRKRICAYQGWRKR